MLADNPCPLYVAWGGPVLGCLLPLALLGIVKLFAKPYSYPAVFFAGFCLVANGAYLAGGSFSGGNTLDDGGRDPQRRRRDLAIAALCDAHSAKRLMDAQRLGTHFGLGKDESRGKVDRKAAAVVAIVFFAVVCIELAVY